MENDYSEPETWTELCKAPKQINVEVELLETSQPLEYKCRNAYTKGNMYCLYMMSGKVVKFPLSNIFRVTEDYE